MFSDAGMNVSRMTSRRNVYFVHVVTKACSKQAHTMFSLSDADSLNGALGTAFELRPKSRPRSVSSSSSVSLDLSSTDDELSLDSPSSGRDTSWSSIDNRDPFSASAKPVNRLKMYSLPDDASSPPRGSSPRGISGSRVPQNQNVTPRAGHPIDYVLIEPSSEKTPRYRSPAVSRRLFDDSVVASESEFWDNVLSNAIDNANGNLDLSCVYTSYCP